MRAFQYKKGWLAEVEPGKPFRMQRGIALRDQTSRKTIREHGELHTVQWVAEYLKVNPETVYDWVETGKLKSFKTGRHIRISDIHLEEFLGAKV